MQVRHHLRNFSKLRKRVAFPLGYPAHYWHHTVLLLTLVHIEQNVKSTSHVSYSFFNFGCKTTISFGIHRYAKCSSLRNKKLAVKGAPFFTILRGNLTRLQGHKLGYE